MDDGLMDCLKLFTGKIASSLEPVVYVLIATAEDLDDVVAVRPTDGAYTVAQMENAFHGVTEATKVFLTPYEPELDSS